MRILILGCTGPSGIAIAREALRVLPCTLVLYARSPQKIPGDILNHETVMVIKGTLEDSDTLSSAMEGADVVLSALGPSGPFHPSGCPLAHAYASVIDIMKARGVKRLIALGTASNQDPKDEFDYRFWVLIKGVAVFARNAYKDIVAIGEVIRNDGDSKSLADVAQRNQELDWTLTRVPILTNDESTDVVAGHVGDGTITTYLSRAAYAAFVINEVQNREWVHESPLLCSPGS